MSGLAQPMLTPAAANSSPRTARRRAKSEGLPYTLDHTEYAFDFSEITCEPGQLWLTAFIASGVALGMMFELLYLFAGPADGVSFLVPFFGYIAQCVVGLLLTTLNRSWPRKGQWTRKMITFMVLSSLCNGAAQACDFVALTQAGVQLYTILHSSVTFFAAVFAVAVLRARLTAVQWIACLSVVLGLVLTGIPTPVPTQGSFATGLICAAVGSLCLAASYPLAELVFRSASTGIHGLPSEELCSCVGSLVNVAAFTAWTLAYTVPRWGALVVAPIATSKFHAPGWACALLYLSHALLVGVHTLAFWKTMRSLGTVPAAISKGAQQALTFLLAHVFFCHIDEFECMTNNHGDGKTLWNKMQKPVSLVVCLLGCVTYAVVKKRPAARGWDASSSRGLSAVHASDAEGPAPYHQGVGERASVAGSETATTTCVQDEGAGAVRFGATAEGAP